MPARKRIAVVGATSAIAEHCCRHWAAAGPCDFVLAGRDAARLDRIAADLRVRGDVEARAEVLDFLDEGAIRAAVGRWASGGPIDIALIAHGIMPKQQDCQDDLAVARSTIEVNAVSPALFAEAFATAMAAAGKGTIAVIGSVAGDRGRRVNYTYGASKAFVDRYVQGMQHRFAGSAVKVVLIKPGPTDTPMAAEHKRKGRRLAPVETVAAGTVAAIAAGRPVTYLPPQWRAIMFVVRNLPAFIFNRLNI